MMFTLSLLTVFFYLLACLAAMRHLLAGRGRPAWPLWASAGLAMALHLAALANEIGHLAAGQDLSMWNVASAISLLISLLMTLLCRRFNGWILLPVVYGFAISLHLINQLIPGHYVTHLETRPLVLLHIGLALSAYSILAIASLFALLLAYLDHHLKSRKRLTVPGLPPLLTVEQRVYQLILVGIALLSLSILSGFLFLDDLFAPGQAHKAILSIVAWCLYLVLLWGHHRHGWRGKTLITISLLGSVLLTLAYFGSRLLYEVILS